MIRKRGLKYQAGFYINQNQKSYKTFDTKTEALEWIKLMNAKKTLGLLNITNKETNTEKDISVNHLVKIWFETEIKRLAPSTQRDYKTCVQKYIFPIIRSELIRTIEPSDCDRIFVKMTSSNLAPKTINKNIAILKQIFGFALKRDLLDRNPARNLSKLKVPPPKDVYLSTTEIQLLLRKSKDKWFKGVILTALNTGMRLGEIAGLQWDMVDFERRVIHVTRNLTKEGLNEFTKTHIKKAIPMNNSIFEFLQQHKCSKLLSKYVFVDINGKPVQPDHFTSRHFKKLTKGTQLSSYRFHDLRHTFASHFMMNGGSVFDLQKILGHTKIEMTMRYAHLSPNYLHDKIQVINFS